MVTLTVETHAPVAAPRGAALAGAVFARILGWFSARSSSRRAQQLGTLRSEEAARVRRFAEQMMGDDPRFAADLFAAADRHERS